MKTQEQLQLQDWLNAEAEYLAERPADGSIPAKQRWYEDTVERRAWEIYRARIAATCLPR